MSECEKQILGPLGTCVGLCELERGHEGPCRVNGVSEQDMLDTITQPVEHHSEDSDE